MSRYYKWNYLASNFLLSKKVTSDIIVPIVNVLSVSAGHYSPLQLNPEHGLILSSITFQTPSVNIHIHGKRKKLTTTLNLNSTFANAINILDYFISILLPSISDIQQLKVKRQVSQNHYGFDLFAYFELADTSPFVSERLLSKRDIFIPLSFQLTLKNSKCSRLNEAYLHMFRLPFQFYKTNYDL